MVRLFRRGTDRPERKLRRPELCAVMRDAVTSACSRHNQALQPTPPLRGARLNAGVGRLDDGDEIHGREFDRLSWHDCYI